MIVMHVTLSYLYVATPRGSIIAEAIAKRPHSLSPTWYCTSMY